MEVNYKVWVEQIEQMFTPKYFTFETDEEDGSTAPFSSTLMEAANGN